VPTARETTRPSRACPSPSRRPKGAPPSRSHTCTTNPPAPRLRPSRSTRRNSRGAVSLSRDSRRCRSPRPTPRDAPALCAGDARSLPGPPVSASGSGTRGSSSGDVCLAEKFASRITSKFSRRDRPKPQVRSQGPDRLSDQVTYSNAFVALCRTRAQTFPLLWAGGRHAYNCSRFRSRLLGD
jgi:hypothetical protein